MRGRGRPLQRYSDYRPPVIQPFHEAEAARRYRRSVTSAGEMKRTSSGASEMSSVGSCVSAASSVYAASSRASSAGAAPSTASSASPAPIASTASSIGTGSSVPVTPDEEKVFDFPTPLMDGRQLERPAFDATAADGDRGSRAASYSKLSSSIVPLDSWVPKTSAERSSNWGSYVEEASTTAHLPKPRTIPPFAAMDELRALSGIPAIYCPSGSDNVDHLYEGFGVEEEEEETKEDATGEEISTWENCQRITANLHQLREVEAAKGKAAAERFKKWTAGRKA